MSKNINLIVIFIINIEIDIVSDIEVLFLAVFQYVYIHCLVLFHHLPFEQRLSSISRVQQGLRVILKYNYTLNCTVLLLSESMTTCLGVTMVRRETYQNNSQVITLSMMKMLNKSTWKIYHNEYKNNKWETIFSMMVSADIEKLEIQRTYEEIALKSISHIQFGQLLQLNLEVNNIKNIEPLSMLNAPSLQKLRLSHNFIVSVRPLVKLRSKYLNQLMIQGNCIKDMDCFFLTNFNKKFKLLCLENWNQKQCQVESLKWLVKSKQNNLLELVIGSERRMKESRMRTLLRQKFQYITFPQLIYN